MAGAAPGPMTLAAFLAWDDGTDTRLELIDGRPVAMGPFTLDHSRIAYNGVAVIERSASIGPAGRCPEPVSSSRTARARTPGSPMS